MLKRTILALSVAALISTGLAQAQENATLVLRSGDRVSGQLVDMGGVGFTMRAGGQERHVPTNDVAVIDFTGSMSDADWAKVNQGQQALLLKNGDVIQGHLFDIAGTSPLRITFKTSSGDREFSSGDIARIVLARPSNAPAAPGSLTAPTGSGLTVSPCQQWTATGITVRRGEAITLRTTGEIQLSTDSNDVATPAGSKSARRAPGAPLPDVLAGALIGRINNGRRFGIGTQTSVPMPEAGQLFLGVNDDGLEDNQGEFRVEIQRSAGPSRR